MTTRVIQPYLDPSQRMRPSRMVPNRNRVSRKLFGPVDHEETQRFLQKELAHEKLLASQNWDFDFDKGEPIKDNAKTRYEWTKVAITFPPRRPKKPEAEPDITQLYASPLPTMSRVEDGKNQPSLSEEDDGDDKKENKEEKIRSKQTNITDFMRIRKRNSESITSKKPESVIPSKKMMYNDVTS